MKLFQRILNRESPYSTNNNNETLNDPLLQSDLFSPSGIFGSSPPPPNTPSPSRPTRTNISYKLMKFLGNLLAITSSLAFLILIPYITYQAIHYDQTRPDFAVFYSAGAFVFITLIMSLKLIHAHLTHWYMPDVQKYVVRILWMVPLYSIQSWLSLRFHTARIYIDTLRDLYEAYVIQSFLYFLMELLGGEDALTLLLQEKDAHYGRHILPVKFLIKDWEMGFEFMMQCKWGVLQYVLVKSIGSILTAVLEPIGVIQEGNMSFTSAYVYLTMMINVSQMWALYCLVKFYHATHSNLANPDWKPLGKFLCIKGVVFFTWWQGVAIAVLKSYGIIGEIGSWDVHDVANGLQDYLICVEMFCFAIAHSFTFTYKEYLPGRINDASGGGYNLGGGDSSSGEGEIPLDYTEFRPPVIRTLNTPMGFRDAFWSSTVPNETLNDIKRFRNGTVEEDLDNSADIGMLRNVSMQHAESV